MPMVPDKCQCQTNPIATNAMHHTNPIATIVIAPLLQLSCLQSPSKTQPPSIHPCVTWGVKGPKRGSPPCPTSKSGPMPEHRLRLPLVKPTRLPLRPTMVKERRWSVLLAPPSCMPKGPHPSAHSSLPNKPLQRERRLAAGGSWC